MAKIQVQRETTKGRDELWAVLTEGRRWSERSEGAFDVTVGPLVNLWGFGNSGERESAPAAGEVRDTLARIGHHRLETRNLPILSTLAGWKHGLG